MSGSECIDLDHCECVDSLYERIKLLEHRCIDLHTRANDLKRWIAYIADDKQIPVWVQQSARGLLAQAGELSMTVPKGYAMTVPKGYAIVPIEPTKSMIDAGLGADSDAFPLKYIYQAMIEAAQEGE